MSAMLTAFTVIAVVLVVVGVQVTSRQIQQFPVDTRSPGPIVETSRLRSFIARPVELEQLHSIVAGSIASEAVAEAKLRPLLNQLRVDAPTAGPAAVPNTDGPTRLRRSHSSRLDRELTELERRWRIEPWR